LVLHYPELPLWNALMPQFANVDAVIVGAGPAGLAAAFACQQIGLKPVVAGTSKSATAEAAKGRSAALFNKSVAFLQRLGVWEACQPAAEPLRTLQFIDDTGRIFRAPDCAFHAAEIGEPAFGYSINNSDLARVFNAEAARRGIAMLSPGRLVDLDSGDAAARLTFEDGTAFFAPLVIAADGRMSAAREAVGIRTLSWSYGQTALAGSFAHELPHNGVCIEFHRGAGPLTLIPLPGNRSSFVWSERRTDAERLLALADAEFAAEMEKASRFALGRISDLTPRAGFPLSSVLVREYGKARVALVGEAAHAAPPIGAQGLNLGLRDVETLAGLIAEAHAEGRDIGSAGVLRAYSVARRGDILSRTLSLDLLNRSLLSGFLPLQAARGAGLYALGTFGPLRRAFMRRGIAPAERL
jgi:2-octaprenyl-6-methoxyphenol hydroxylase